MADPEFLTDDNVSDSLVGVFREFGYVVTLARERFGAMSSDPLLLKTAEQRGLVLVTHDKDFKHLQSFAESSCSFQIGAGLILFACDNPLAPRRARVLMEVISFHHERAVRLKLRFAMRITSNYVAIWEKDTPESAGDQSQAEAADQKLP